MIATEDASEKYEIGYGKPPRSTQFKKGQSGNRKGRPMARTDISGLLAEALDEPIRITRGGVEKSVSKTRAVLTALVNRALQADPKALRLLSKLLAKTGNLEHVSDYRDPIRPIHSETRLTLVTSIACGRRWLDEIVTGIVTDAEEIAAREKCSVRQVNMTISLAFLSPTLVIAAIDGTLPRGVGVARLRDAPVEWSRQHAMLGLAS